MIQEKSFKHPARQLSLELSISEPEIKERVKLTQEEKSELIDVLADLLVNFAAVKMQNKKGKRNEF